MMKHFSIAFITTCVILSFVLQFFGGNIPLDTIAFPVNLSILGILIGSMYVLFNEKRQHAYLHAWAAPQTSVFLLLAIGFCCLIVALVPQWNVQQSWPFNMLLFLLLSQLLLSIFYYKGPFRKRFYLNHIGIFILLSSLSLGAADMHRWKVVIQLGETIDTALDHKGIPHSLGYPLKLENFKVTYYDNMTPQSYRAVVSSQGKEQEIQVNHPWHKSWQEDIYITNYGRLQSTGLDYCVVEIIRQPWKYLTILGLVLTALGAIMLLWGKKSRTKVS